MTDTTAVNGTVAALGALVSAVSRVVIALDDAQDAEMYTDPREVWYGLVNIAVNAQDNTPATEAALNALRDMIEHSLESPLSCKQALTPESA